MIKAYCYTSFTTTVTVEDLLGDLVRVEWGFEYFEKLHSLKLMSYRLSSRKTKRHSWEAAQVFDCRDERKNTIAEMPEPISDILDAARNEFVNSLQVTRRHTS